jgi:hypothetical protein
MTTLADVLMYLELYADDLALAHLQEVEIPRIQRQRRPRMSSQHEDAYAAAKNAPQSPR